jgi:hypothetical protein
MVRWQKMFRDLFVYGYNGSKSWSRKSPQHQESLSEASAVQFSSANRKTNACICNVNVVVVCAVSGVSKDKRLAKPKGSEDLLESQNLGDSSLGDHHDGGLEVSGRQVGVDAAVDDELREH